LSFPHQLKNLRKVESGPKELPLVPLSVPQLQFYLGFTRHSKGVNKMKKVLNLIKNKVVKPDGTLNGKIISGLVALIIVFVQHIFAFFGVQPKGDVTAFVGLANTALTILGLVGVLSDPTPVEVLVKAENKVSEK